MASSIHEVTLAGLLHDIGKLYQRAYGNSGPVDFSEKGFTHQDYTAYFIQKFSLFTSQLADIAKRHHLAENTPERLQPRADEPRDWVVYFADNYASSERSDTGQTPDTAVQNTPLATIFSQITIGGNTGNKTVYKFLPEGSTGLQPGLTYPVEPEEANVRRDSYKRLVEELESRVTDLAKLRPNDNAALANLTMFLLEGLWPVPADTRGDTGISLYDHLRLTAAFAAALYSYHLENGLTIKAIRNESPQKFLLVGGDVAGIQNHIYRITDAQGQGGVAKRLRARSLEVSLAAEAMSIGLLERLGLTPLQRIMSAGGKFYLLLPNTEGAKSELDEHRGEWEEWALNQGASLLPVLSAVPFGPEELKSSGFAGVFKRLLGAMAQDKLHPLASQQARFAAPYAERQGQSLRPCVVCGVRPAQSDDPGAVCIECERDRLVGGKLPQTRSLSVAANPVKPYYQFPLLNFDLRSNEYVLRGEADFSPAAYPWELRPLLGHLPTVADALEAKNLDPDDYLVFLEEQGLSLDDDELSTHKPLTFGELAHLSSGASYLGALMLDADRMGEAFAKGFAHLKEEKGPGRIAALSRSVDTFFTLEVGGLIKEAARYEKHLGYSRKEAEEKGRRYQLIYTVYSGGDDLFLIGPWDVLLDFAADLNELYRRYTRHPAFTISGGFALLKPTTPVPLIYEAVHGAEQQAKEKGKDPNSPTQGRGHLALFGQAVTWENINHLKPWTNWLVEELSSGRFPSALAYRLLKLYRHFAEEPDLAKKMFYKPQLAYLLRNYSDDRKYPKYYEQLKQLLDHTQPAWAHLPVWVEWGLYGARGRKG